MTIEELIKTGKEKVRGNAVLLNAYKKVFKEKFGREPDCAGCTFTTDWARLTNPSIQPQKKHAMSNKTFDLIHQGKIYSYDVFDKKTKRTKRVRAYGNLMTEDFATAYLINGTPEEIEIRKKQFRTLPESLQTETTDISKLTVKELKELAAGHGHPEDEYSDLKKADLISYIETKSIEVE